MPNNWRLGRSLPVVSGRGGATVVGRCTEARNSANSPRIRITILATEVRRLARRLGDGPGSRRSEHNLLRVMNREHNLLSCLGGGSVRECHSLVRELNVEGWSLRAKQGPCDFLPYFSYSVLRLRGGQQRGNILLKLLWMSEILRAVWGTGAKTVPEPLADTLGPIYFSMISTTLSFTFSVVQDIFKAVSGGMGRGRERGMWSVFRKANQACIGHEHEPYDNANG